MSNKYERDDILKAAIRQEHWAMDALDEAYSAKERAKREKAKGLMFCYKDSMREVKACLYWAKLRKNLAKKYRAMLD
jgi:hypothetical protein